MSLTSNYRNKKRNRNRSRINVRICVLLTFIVLLLALLNVRIGAAPIPWREFMFAWLGQGDTDLSYIILNYRLPRTVLAVLAGAGLSVSGLVAQSVLRNPLASPDTLGISSGAALGAVITVMLIPVQYQHPFLTSIAAFAGGSLGAIVVYLLSYKNGLDPVRLALVGIAASACGSTLVQLLITRSSTGTQTALLWLNGSLWGRTWEQVLQIFPLIILLIPMIWLLARTMDVLALGDASSRGLGIRLEPMRLVLLAAAVLLASSSVSSVGMIGFVGLTAPHIARKLMRGAHHRAAIPAAALTGALIMLLADVIGRMLMPPIEFPAGLVTSIIGAPYFLMLLWRESRSKRRSS